MATVQSSNSSMPLINKVIHSYHISVPENSCSMSGRKASSSSDSSPKKPFKKFPKKEKKFKRSVSDSVLLNDSHDQKIQVINDLRKQAKRDSEVQLSHHFTIYRTPASNHDKSFQYVKNDFKVYPDCCFNDATSSYETFQPNSANIIHIVGLGIKLREFL